MSLSETLHKQIEKVLEGYWNLLVDKYDLDKDELRDLWHGGKAKTVKPTKKSGKSLTDVDMDDLSPVRLLKCTVAELKALCRQHGHKVGGKKAELIDRLQGKDGPPAGRGSSSGKNKPKKGKKNNRAVTSTDVVKKLTAHVPVIPVRPNSFGNLEHPETGLVFDRKTEKVIGKQLDDGKVADLTESDIEACKKFKFMYTIPDNLDQKTSLDEVRVDELEESDEEIQDDSESEVEIIDDGSEIEDDSDDEIVVSDEESE